MAKLIFGELEEAYAEAYGGKSRTTTTAQVGEILEQRYHVMQTFFDLRKGQIAEYLADGMAIVLQDHLSGRKTPAGPMTRAEQQMEAAFRSFLDANEMQKLALALGRAPISGAAMRGVSHTKLHPYASKNRARPAFIDTGLYRLNFRAEVKL